MRVKEQGLGREGMKMCDAIHRACVEDYMKTASESEGEPTYPGAASGWIDEEAGLYELRNLVGRLARYQVIGDEVDGFTVERLPMVSFEEELAAWDDEEVLASMFRGDAGIEEEELSEAEFKRLRAELYPGLC